MDTQMNRQTLIHYGIIKMWHDKVLLFLELRTNPHVISINETPLHKAAKNSDTLLLRILLTHGANPYLVNFIGKTPLQLGTAKRGIEVVKILFSEMNYFLMKNSLGHNILYYATKFICKMSEKEIVQQNLLTNPNKTTNNGKTTLHLAIKKNRCTSGC